ncbi:ABC transporter ATP-binding protein [Aquitalea aquatica]|uniref:ABC transporter ATP-binding protein n=1 Tax=Aquitalea aquatica TaxID=3044273 RepID=A0A838YJ77_9NEIS|nr:dipeptide ABC transporter ATP-binding protein [Aquitalea magnusonii]MBA4710631.1 ABC transporter ATP-binding protein [Aquitalea magnusonii]
METLLTVAALNAHFGRQQVLSSVGFSVAAGEKVALVGESGSGKTVTAQALLQLNPDVRLSGSIRLAGEELLGAGEKRLRQIRGRDIAMIFQEPMHALNPLFTIGRQIGETLTLHLGLTAREARAEAIRLLLRTGISEAADKIDSYPFQLSGGQRQRAMIAMALACRPRLLIADEPTTALDVTVQAQILQLLDELQQELGMAVLFITHDLNLVRRFADKVVVMRGGLVVESGKVAQVFRQPSHPYTAELLASRPDVLDDAAAPAAPPRLQVRNLAVSYLQKRGLLRRHEQTVLQDVSLSVPAGRTLGIVGESGSGKTTLGLALLRLLPCQGEISLDDVDLQGLRGGALRRARKDFQVVFQDPFAALSPRLTVGQIVAEGLELHQPQLSRAEIRQQVVATLAEVGLHHEFMERYPHEFSGGQRQRIAIARALILKPKLLLLDEPTSALDATLQKQVLQLLRSLQRKYGLSYLFISHDLAVIRAVAHQVLVLQGGRIVEQGDAAQLFAAPQQAYTRQLLAAALPDS